MNKNFFFKRRKLFIITTILLFSFSVFSYRANAVMYSPGETLNPACAPADVSCGISVQSNATSSDVYKYAPATIVAWGDSLTAGTGGSGTTYPAVLQSVSGVSVYNGGVGGETSTQIATRMLAATDKFSWPVIIWSGRNNFSSQSTVLADIASMVAVLNTDNYLILGVINGSTEVSGSNSYNQIVSLNSALSSTYGSHYVDIRSYLVSQYNAGVPQDVTDHGNDVIPSSLRSDTLHLNAAGYTAIANYLFTNYFSYVSPTASHKTVTTDVLGTLKSYVLASPVFTGSLSIESATSSLYGVIYKGGVRFIHDYFNSSNDGKNIFLGVGAGNLTMGSSTGAVYSGSYNAIVGYSALSSNTTGAYNAGVGAYVLQNNSTGRDNAAFGNGSLQTNTTGSSNTAVGRSTLSTNSSGTQNVAVGTYSLQYATTPSNNTGIGFHGLRYLTTGSGNTAVGYKAGVGQSDISNYNTTIDTYSTFIGYGASRSNTIASTTVLTNATAIGYNATVGTSSSLILGGTGAYAVKVGIGTTTPGAQLETTGTVRFANFGSGTLTTDANGNLSVSSDERLKDVKGNFERSLKEVVTLQPINFIWKAESGFDTNNVYTGFSAQNVEKAIPEAVGKDKNGFLTLSDRPILAAVVNSVKELSNKVDNPSVGTSDKPKGITMYDTATGQPYCLRITYGQISTISGKCENISSQNNITNITTVTNSNQNSEVVPSNQVQDNTSTTTENVPSTTPTPTPDPTPTPGIELTNNATSTDQ